MSETARLQRVPLRDAYGYARRQLEAGDAEASARTCESLLAAYPHDFRAHLLAGEARAELGDLDRARESFERAVSADPEDAAAHVGLGVLAERRGDRDAALREYGTALRLDPTLDPTLAEVRERAAEIAGSSPTHLTSAGLMLVRLRAGDVLGALGVWEEIPAAERDEPWLRLALLEALWRAGRTDEARELSTRMLDTVPGSLKPALIISFCHALEGDAESAGSVLEELREFDPSGEWLLSRAYMAPASWEPPLWDAAADIEVPAQREYVAESVVEWAPVDTPADASAYAAAEYQLPVGGDDLSQAGGYASEQDGNPAPAHQEGSAVEGAAPADLAATYGDLYAELGADPDDPYAAYLGSERDLSYLYANVMQDLGGAPGTTPPEIDPLTPASPEAPTFPEPAPEPDGPLPRPEAPDLPLGPEIEPPAIQPGYTPTPEITDVPPSTIPEVPPAPPPATPPPVVAVQPVPASPTLERAAELEGAGYYGDALELYAQAYRRGEADAGSLLPRVTALAPHLMGSAPWHQLLGDLYRRAGMSRRAMREYQLALRARRREG